MLFQNIYIHLLKESKIADYIQQLFDNACSYFSFLDNNDDINEYQWTYGNSTGFQILIVNNYQNISFTLKYNNTIIIQNKFEITDISEKTKNNIAAFIRQNLNQILKFNFNNIPLIEIEKLKSVII